MKQDKYTKTLAKKYFKCEILGKTVYLNLKSFVWNTNMAAGYQQKHLSSSFPTNA